MIGSTIGYRYQVVSKVGEGALFQVYKANDRLLQRPVALKVLRPEFQVEKEFVDNLKNVVEASLNLLHPNLVRYLAIRESGAGVFLVCDLVGDENLESSLMRRVPLPVAHALRLTHQVCDALSYLHQMGMVHGDVRPHNLLTSSRGESKLGDYCLFRAFSASKLVEADWVSRSIFYWAPERIQGQAPSPQSDLYAVGVLLFQSLTGVLPFEGTTPMEVSYKHLHESPPTPSSFNPAVPRAVDDIVLKALHKEPEQRFESAKAMEEAIRETADALDRAAVLVGTEWGKEATESNSAEPEEEEAPSGKRRGMSFFWRLVALMVGLLAGFFGLGFLVLSLLVGTRPKEVALPNLSGLPKNEASKRLEELGLSMEVRHEFSRTFPAEHVIRYHRLAPGRKVNRGQVVSVVVSRGPELATVPEMAGVSLSEAAQALKGVGLEVGQKVETYHDTIPKGHVIGQQPAPGYRLMKGEKVNLIVSLGPAPPAISPFDEEGLAPPGTKGARITINVGKGPLRQVVEIVVVDEEGKHSVYKGTHAPGDLILREVVGKGESVKVQVFINGTLVEEQAL